MELVGPPRRRGRGKEHRGGTVCSAMLFAAGGLVLATLTATLAPKTMHTMAAALGIERAPVEPHPAQAPAPAAPPGATAAREEKPVFRTMAPGGLTTLTHQGRKISYYQARPEGEGTWPGVILASSGWGIDQELKAMASRLAAEGFLVLAPEINGGKVANDPDKARELGVLMDAERAVADLNALANHLKFSSEVGDHRVGLVGLDAGGKVALVAARLSEDLSCVVTLHAAPEKDADALRRINMPILAIFGGADPATPAPDVAAFRQALDAAGRTSEVKVYENAGRAFAHAKEPGYDANAAADAFSLIVSFLRANL